MYGEYNPSLNQNPKTPKPQNPTIVKILLQHYNNNI
jgi:hypothetical protein